MNPTFGYSSDGIEFKVLLEPHSKLTKHTLSLKSTGFTPTGIRIKGTRLYEAMISHITLGENSLTTTPFSLSVIQSFKAYVDGRISGQKMNRGDVLSFHLENRGNEQLMITICIDGKKTDTK
jgi:hypothetical protein